MLKDHWEEYEDTESRGDIFVEGELPDGTKVEFHFYHEMGSEKYDVDVYDPTSNRIIGRLAE
ncbi:MAG: hypothetical protein CMM27_10485 [Rhodospirillaceae bacterium]|nr:hypothetical protein [Rhodospirillaceae bacterium]|tara:strand:+ start:882 stop:1067 length:186 start_codon:yes stop_codon:yes gene_type:complete